MKSLALKRAPEMQRPNPLAASAPSEVLAQRHSTFGPGATTAPRIVDAGRPLDATTRSAMEAGFGRDFSNIRIHDDARAHDNARALNAHAYAAGDNLVFAAGAYRPDTVGGRALLAHELAHSVQQAGVQMKSDGPLPASADAELEAQADRAALSVTSGRPAPALSTIGRVAVFRSNGSVGAGGSTASTAPGPVQNLPPGMNVITDDPPGLGTNELVVSVSNFALPLEKGMGEWVAQAYNEAATGRRLVFSPLIEGGKVAAYKEGNEDYKSIWLGKFGFTSTKGLADAFKSAAKTNDDVKAALTDKGVATLITGMSTNLKSAGCDVDHIVEKQMGGTSIPSNLQVLNSKKNRAAGSETYQQLVALVQSIRDPKMRGPNVRKLQLQLQSATVPAGTSDPSFIVEGLLRKGVVKGSDEVKAKAEGKPVALSAGGVGETVNVRDAGRTPIDSMAKRIVPGMRLVTYARGAPGAKNNVDKVEGELDSRAISKTGADAKVVLTAETGAATAPSPATGGAPADQSEAASESRVLKIDKAANKKIAFFYPYLSPGTLTSISMDANGGLTGTGTIKPSVPFLGELNIRYGDDLLEMTAPLTPEKLKPPFPGFRFTEGSLSLKLFPTFLPEGNLKFAVGPAAKPVMLGELSAKYEGGAFIAAGTLTPGAAIPGISAAKGTVEYNSNKGWSAELQAQSSSLPGATNVTALLGFSSQKGAYATGGITARIKESDLKLEIGWRGHAVSYKGHAKVPKPLPLVKEVTLDGKYEEGLLHLTGKANISWRSINSEMTVTYSRRDGGAEKFSGAADIKIAQEKLAGELGLRIDEAGKVSGKGQLSYQLTKDIRPTLGVELKDDRVRMFGEVALADMTLSTMWPAPNGGSMTLMKAGVKFSFPTPLPAVTAYIQIRASARLSYGVGPVMLKGVVFSGELYPLEDDLQVKARVKGLLAVPAYAEIGGSFGASIGAELLGGAIGARGGISVFPRLRLEGEGGAKFDAGYESGGFDFSAEAFVKGKLVAKLGVNLEAELYAAYGLFSHTWEYQIANFEAQIGPEITLTLGKIAYSRAAGITWPSLSQIKLQPENIDPYDIIHSLLTRGKANKHD